MAYYDYNTEKLLFELILILVYYIEEQKNLKLKIIFKLYLILIDIMYQWLKNIVILLWKNYIVKYHELNILEYYLMKLEYIIYQLLVMLMLVLLHYYGHLKNEKNWNSMSEFQGLDFTLLILDQVVLLKIYLLDYMIYMLLAASPIVVTLQLWMKSKTYQLIEFGNKDLILEYLLLMLLIGALPVCEV
eukprot:17514_2